jgi:hypothetical protein
VAIGGQPRDLRLLGREVVARLGGPPGHHLAGRGQLATGVLGERLSADAAERLVRPVELVARVDGPLLAPQPLAVEQLRTRDVDEDAAAPEPVDRLAVLRAAASPLLSNARERARIPSAQLVPATPVRSSSRASAAAASSGAPARAPASTSSASDQPKNPRS